MKTTLNSKWKMKSCEVQSTIILLRSEVLCLSKTHSVAERERKHEDSTGEGWLQFVLNLQLVLLPRSVCTDWHETRASYSGSTVWLFQLHWGLMHVTGLYDIPVHEAWYWLDSSVLPEGSILGCNSRNVIIWENSRTDMFHIPRHTIWFHFFFFFLNAVTFEEEHNSTNPQTSMKQSLFPFQLTRSIEKGCVFFFPPCRGLEQGTDIKAWLKSRTWVWILTVG